jgi:hypothetical protein
MENVQKPSNSEKKNTDVLTINGNLKCREEKIPYYVVNYLLWIWSLLSLVITAADPHTWLIK